MRREYPQEGLSSTELDWNLIKRLFIYLRPFKLALIFSFVFLMISKCIEALVPILVGNLSQKILSGINLPSSQQLTLLSTVLIIGGFIFTIQLSSYFLDLFNVVLKSRIGQNALFTLRQQVYEHILRLPLSYFDRQAVGRLMTRTIHDIDQINQMFTESFVPILGSLFLFVAIYLGIFFINWHIGIMVTLLLPFVGWLTLRFRFYQRRAYERVRAVVSAMNSFVQEHLMGAVVIRNFGIQKRSQEQFEEINEDYCNAYLEGIHHFSLFIAGLDLLQNFSLIMVFVLLILLAPAETGFQAGIYFTFSLYALLFFRPLTDLADRYNVLQSAMAAAERIFGILDTPCESLDAPEGADLEEIETISFEDVWFAYVDKEWVLKGMSFEIKQGESVAIVGVTGEGKTTITNLLLRFYDYQSGKIKINGREITEYSLHAVRKQFSIVLQDPVIFSGTILDNISLYDPKISLEEVEKVIDNFHLQTFIDRFPQRLHHQLSERGKSLSTGERQLISLARAAVHQRSVLILDEATSNIDSFSEKMIQQALQKLLQKKTALVIAHRLSTIKDVSKILVINNGIIAESGSHEHLLKQKGIYEKLYRLQFTS